MYQKKKKINKINNYIKKKKYKMLLEINFEISNEILMENNNINNANNNETKCIGHIFSNIF
jgi:hypothetical protein